MSTFLGFIFLIIAFLLTGLILLQEGKGGGLAAMGGAMTDSVMGAKNPLRRLTAYFFVAFVVVSIGINMMISRETSPEFGAGISAPAAVTEEAKDAPAAEKKEETPVEKPADSAKPAEEAKESEPAK